MKSDSILLDHGSGGKVSNQFLSNVILPIFNNPILAQLHDGALITIQNRRLAFSTDTFVVSPIFFPGGDIGCLAVNGTVNDLAMCGAEPLYLSVGMVIEEGFSISDLNRILISMKDSATLAQVEIVTGDTKVVPKGAVDKIFINTSGIGVVYDGVNISSHCATIGDKIILSGTLADHGMSILIQREGLTFDAPISSDSAPLNHIIKEILKRFPEDVHVLRDPTRGGVGTALNEIAYKSDIGIRIYEAQLPIKPEVAGVCELLGFDPIYIANEGKFLAFVNPHKTDQILEIIQKHPLGKNACIIGEVVSDHKGKVYMQTKIGGVRMIDMLTGEQLPRIC